MYEPVRDVSTVNYEYIARCGAKLKKGFMSYVFLSGITTSLIIAKSPLMQSCVHTRDICNFSESMVKMRNSVGKLTVL